MYLLIDLKNMINDIDKKNKWLGIWGKALNLPMIIAPTLFYNISTVWIVFICNLIAILIAGQIHKKIALSRLTSICHFAWIPMLIFITRDLSKDISDVYYQIWLIYVALTVAISLVLDAFNLIKFIMGDKGQIG